MKKKQNFSRKGKQELKARYGYSSSEAKAVWERSYRQALRTARQSGVTKNINITRELYASMFYRGNQLFDVDLTGILPQTKISTDFRGNKNVEEIFIEKRFEGMADKYEEIDLLLQEYKSGKKTYKEFREGVETFKLTNREYQTSGSG